MSLFSEQPLFCSNCGRPAPKAGFSHHQWITCTIECNREMHWKYTLSVMGKPYRPRSFMSRVRDGEKVDVDVFVEQWHNDYKGPLALHEYLGMTAEEYKKFVEKSEIPK